MKTFQQFLEESGYILTEELHKEIQDILDGASETEVKHALITAKLRHLAKRGEDSGLESSKPKKGSSRAVYFPIDNKEITLDGQPAKLKTVVKMSFPGNLDKFKRDDEPLLGSMQNEIEGDHFIRNNYGMLRENADGSYSTNHDGVLAPVVHAHEYYDHLEMGHVTPIKKSDFQRLTITPSHPKGIKFDDMKNALLKEHNDAYGRTGEHYPLPRHHTDSFHEHIMSHPFVENVYNMMLNTGFHPGDISLRNMGLWKHPVTGKEYPVMSDYGFTNEIAIAYSKRRQRAYAHFRGY